MMRFILIQMMLVGLVFAESLGADIFGLKMGMSVSEIRALGFGELQKAQDTPEKVWAVKNPRMPKNADLAAFIIVPGKGLLKVVFVWEIEADTYSDATKEKFEELKKILADKYGKGEIPDRLKSWINALMGKDRVLSWVSTNPTNEIAAIVLSAKGSATKSGNVTLSYEFRGWTEHVEEREKKEASQF